MLNDLIATNLSYLTDFSVGSWRRKPLTVQPVPPSPAPSIPCTATFCLPRDSRILPSQLSHTAWLLRSRHPAGGIRAVRAPPPSALRDRMLRACLTESRTPFLTLYLLNMYFELDVAFSLSFRHSCGQHQELPQRASPSPSLSHRETCSNPTEHAQMAEGIYITQKEEKY